MQWQMMSPAFTGWDNQGKEEAPAAGRPERNRI